MPVLAKLQEQHTDIRTISEQPTQTNITVKTAQVSIRTHDTNQHTAHAQRKFLKQKFIRDAILLGIIGFLAILVDALSGFLGVMSIADTYGLASVLFQAIAWIAATGMLLSFSLFCYEKVRVSYFLRRYYPERYQAHLDRQHATEKAEALKHAEEDTKNEKPSTLHKTLTTVPRLLFVNQTCGVTLKWLIAIFMCIGSVMGMLEIGNFVQSLLISAGMAATLAPQIIVPLFIVLAIVATLCRFKDFMSFSGPNIEAGYGTPSKGKGLLLTVAHTLDSKYQTRLTKHVLTFNYWIAKAEERFKEVIAVGACLGFSAFKYYGLLKFLYYIASLFTLSLSAAVIDTLCALAFVTVAIFTYFSSGRSIKDKATTECDEAKRALDAYDKQHQDTDAIPDKTNSTLMEATKVPKQVQAKTINTTGGASEHTDNKEENSHHPSDVQKAVRLG